MFGPIPDTDKKPDSFSSPVLDAELESLPSLPEIPTFNPHPVTFEQPDVSPTNIMDFRNQLYQMLRTPIGQQVLMDMVPSVAPKPVPLSSTNKSISPDSILVKSKRKFQTPKVKYSGVVGTLESWTTEWKNFFRSDGVVDEIEKIGLVRESLSGPVKSWYINLTGTDIENDFKSFDEMVEHFRRRWEPGVDISYWYEKFFSLRCSSSIRDFSNDFTVIYQKLRSVVPSHVALQLYLFLVPERLRLELRLRNTTTLEETIDLAVRMELFAPHLISSPTVRVNGQFQAPRSNNNNNNNGSKQQPRPSQTSTPPAVKTDQGKTVKVPSRPCRFCQGAHMDYECPSAPPEARKRKGKPATPNVSGSSTAVVSSSVGGSAPAKTSAQQ
jgi:hypothetical protein